MAAQAATDMLVALGRDASADILEASLTGAGVRLHIVRSERATGAALVSESFPARHRGKALAFVQSSWAIGYGRSSMHRSSTSASSMTRPA